MTDAHQTPPAPELRVARSTVATLEEENRTVRAELNLVLSSKARRFLLALGHPVWVVRAAASWFVDWTPVGAALELWRSFRFHRVALGSLDARF